MSEKIQPSHIEREAYVYIRQSSMQQVRTRLEDKGWGFESRHPCHPSSMFHKLALSDHFRKVRRQPFSHRLGKACPSSASEDQDLIRPGSSAALNCNPS
jgi:hypothetical protein